jgi:catechol 2,3-dioxygenase-like lactoylglutathione lyase family enzyme
MRVELTSIFVEDQAKALEFYTKILGFVLRDDIDMGAQGRWLTVYAPEKPDGASIVLEPVGLPEARAFKEALYKGTIPLLLLTVDDIQAEYKRLLGLGVKFSMPPTPGGPITMAVFDDTCGNWVMIAQPNA